MINIVCSWERDTNDGYRHKDSNKAGQTKRAKRVGEIYRNTDIDINIVRKTETEMEERETEKKWTAYKEKQANKKMIWQTHSKRFRQREKIHCPTFLYQCTQLMVKLNIAILSWVYKQKFPKQSNISKSRSQNQYIKNVFRNEHRLM